MFKKVTFMFVIGFLGACTLNKAIKKSKINETISIGSFAKEVKLKIGQKAKVVMTSHASVGIGSSVYSNNNLVFKLIDKKFKYDNPAKSNLPGGDRGKTTYIFQAMTKGSTTLRIKKGFRGKTEHDQEVNIIVE